MFCRVTPYYLFITNYYQGGKGTFSYGSYPPFTPFTSQRLGVTPRSLWECGRKSFGFSTFLLCFVRFLLYCTCISICFFVLSSSFESLTLPQDDSEVVFPLQFSHSVPRRVILSGKISKEFCSRRISFFIQKATSDTF